MDNLALLPLPPAAAVVFHSIQPHDANLDDNTQTPKRICVHVNMHSNRQCKRKTIANSDVLVGFCCITLTQISWDGTIRGRQDRVHSEERYTCMTAGGPGRAGKKAHTYQKYT